MSEFAPGNKVFVHQSPVKCEVIRQLNEHWLEVISEDGKNAYRVPVQFAAPENSITLTLTREQAEKLKYDLYTNYMCGSVQELIKQIEEKLNGL